MKTRRYLGGVSSFRMDGNDFMPDPNRPVSTQVKEKKKQEEVDVEVKKKQKKEQEEQLDKDFDAVNVLDAVGATGIPVVSEAGDLASAAVSASRGNYDDAALSLAGFMVPFVGGVAAKQTVKFASKTEMADRINLAIKNNDAKIIESDPRFTKEQKTEILTNSKMPWNQAKDLEYKVRINDANSTVVTDKLRKKGKDLDNLVSSSKTPTVYGDDAFEFVGYSRSKSGKLDKSRPIVEVTLPTGKVQKFYKSSGSGKKAGSAGNWYPLESQTSSGWWSKEASRGTYKGEKLEGFYENAAGKRVSSDDRDAVFISVHEQLKRKGVDPDKAFSSGELKLDKTGYDFHYGSKEYKKISDRLDEMPNIEG